MGDRLFNKGDRSSSEKYNEGWDRIWGKKKKKKKKETIVSK